MIAIANQELDRWVTDPNGPVALSLKQKLLPVDGSDIIFPPTYADIGYNIDTLSDGTRVATIDSVGSQANRLEPIFKSDSPTLEDWLVPQISIVLRREPCGKCESCRKNATSSGDKKAKKEPCKEPREIARSLLELAHRAADAVVRSSPTLFQLVGPAFKMLQQGDAGPLCAIAPTSLVFGVWDSRGDTGEKRPRLVRSIIRAWDVEPLHSAAQFTSVWRFLDGPQKEELRKRQEELRKQQEKQKGKGTKTDLSDHGLADTPAVFLRKTKAPHFLEDGSPNPAARILGGVLVKGRIEREVTVNLVALRGLRGANDNETEAIRKYLLGLSLVAATAEIDLFLREGCLLRYAENGDTWYAVPRRGDPVHVGLSASIAMEYAKNAAKHFRSRWPQASALKHEFDITAAKDLLANIAEEEAA